MKNRGKFKMSEENKEGLRLELEKQTDWVGTCIWCKAKLTGSLADLRKHKEVCSNAPVS